jgi:hypothetical protein
MDGTVALCESLPATMQIRYRRYAWRDSLRAMRLISGVHRAFQCELSVQALFDAPTIAEMAKVLAPHEAGGAG